MSTPTVNMSWSFDFSPTPPPPRDPTLYAAVPGATHLIDAQTSLFRSDAGQIAIRLASLDARVLEHCPDYHTLDMHAQRVAEASGLGLAQVRAIVERLRASRLLRNFAEQCQTRPPRVLEPDDRAPLFVIRTYHRPTALAALLASAAADEQRLGIRRQFVVVDDAPELEHIQRSREIVADARARLGLDVRIFDHECHDAAFRDLGITPGSAVAGALSARQEPTHGGGRSWNWAVLLSAGRPMAILDDDVHFPFRMPVGTSERFSARSNHAAESRFPDPGEDWPLTVMDHDPYAVAAAWLGRSATELHAECGFPVEALKGKPAGQHGAWESHRRVVAVTPGIYGGLTFDSAAYLSLDVGGTLTDLLRSPYRQERLEGDRLWSGWLSPRLLDYAVYTPMLVDGRALLPPTTTHARADDTVFLALLRSICNDAAFVHAPMSIGHAPINARHRIERGLKPLLTDANGFVAQFINDFASVLNSGRRDVRLRAIAATAVDFAEDPANVAEHAARWRDLLMSSLITGLEAALTAHPNGPGEWRNYVQQVIAVNRAALGTPADEALALHAWRGIRQLGAMGSGWVDAWQAAHEGGAARILDRIVA